MPRFQCPANGDRSGCRHAEISRRADSLSRHKQTAGLTTIGGVANPAQLLLAQLRDFEPRNCFGSAGIKCLQWRGTAKLWEKILATETDLAMRASEAG